MCLTNFLVPKNIIDKRGGKEGASRFSVKGFLSHSGENFRRGTVLFHKFLVSKIFLDKREGGVEGVS